MVEGVNFKLNVSLGIQYNVQHCTEMSCLQSPNPHWVEVEVERSLSKKCYKLHDMCKM